MSKNTNEVLKRQKDFYNKKYAEWPQLRSVDMFWQHVSDEIIRLLNIKKGKKYLYLGVGDGYIVEYIAKKTGALIYGIDVSDYSLLFCNKSKGDTSYYICADAQQLPFKANSFSGIIAPAVLHHLPDLKKAFSEFNRVLYDDNIIFSLDPKDYILRNCFDFILRRIISEDEIQFKQAELEGKIISAGFNIKSNQPLYIFMPIIVPLFRRLRLDIPDRLFRFFLSIDTYFAKKRFFQPLSWIISLVITK